MLRKALRVLGWVAYVALVAVCFAFAGYSSFSLFVRSGVTGVPDLTGLPEIEVEGRLADNGLVRRPAQGGDRYDEEVQVGLVLEQSPGSGSLVKRGSAVEVTLSLGPERLVVPELEGEAVQAAQVTLVAAGMAMGRSATIFRPGCLPGTVVEQVPAAASRVGRDAPIDLYVCQESRTDTFLMPDLTYRSFTAVRRYFDLRGFRMGTVRFEPYEGISPGIVLRQYPLPGHPLRRNDVISLVVSTMEEMGT